MTTSFNYADVYEHIADAIPDAPCVAQGDRTLSWRNFDRRCNALATDLLAAGVSHQGRVGAYLFNSPEYLEATVGAFKAGAVPFNTNFRYGPEELAYLWEDADAEAIVFHSGFSDIVAAVREKLPRVRRWYFVDDPKDADPQRAMPDWATRYEAVVAPGAERPQLDRPRSGDDQLFLYTGGTTGMPKGVMWRQDDLFRALGQGGHVVYGIDPIESIDEAGSRQKGPGPRLLPACPLMHGTGLANALCAHAMGGSVQLLEGRGFDATELWDVVARTGTYAIAVVGDAFARPMLNALDAHHGRWNLSELRLIASSGVMFSEEVKRGLCAHMHPDALIFDSYGSSEAIGLGGSLSGSKQQEKTATFAAGVGVALFHDDGRRLAAGSDEIGRVAIPGPIPLGYHKDPEKTARTFIAHEGTRYSMPGDYARIRADGTLELLGRGSQCINTGGEKVYPEEVEEVLKQHPSIDDAACVGLPDERFGQVICAVVETAASLDEAEVVAHVKARLAAYKAPRLLLSVASVGRAPNGKLDYKALQQQASAHFGR